jgi:hypothetical protein
MTKDMFAFDKALKTVTVYDTTGVGANAKKAASYGADIVGNTIATNGQLVVQHTGPTAAGNTASAAVDPASGEVVYLSFTFADSDAP